LTVAKVLSVTPDERGKKYHIDIDVDGKSSSYTVSAEVYGEIGLLTVGDELDEYAFSVVRHSHECYLALKRAYYYLGSRDRSRKELKTKIVEAGFSAEAAQYAVDRLDELGYINEAEQLERAVLREANTSLRGPRLIIDKLRMKGYDQSEIRRTVDRLVDEGAIDFKANFERLAEKKRVTDDKRYALKYRYGYEF
jgi:regulatory protein